MSYNKTTLQKSDPEFMKQAHSIHKQCQDNAAIWDLEPDRMVEFDMSLAAADIAFEANNDVTRRNAMTASVKKAAFGELKHFLGMFINYLEVNLKVPDTALEFMGLRPRHQHVHLPQPRPKDNIVLSVQRQHDEMTVYATRPEHDQPTAGVGPARYYGFMLRYRMEDETNYQTLLSTRLHHTMYFNRADEGKRIYLSAAWVNRRQETGPWSEDILEVIG